MRAQSQAWKVYLDHLREVAQLLVADPESTFGKRQYSAPVLGKGHEVLLSASLSRGALVLTCSHLQGYFLSAVQEFLEAIDGAGVEAGRLSPKFRAELCMRFPFPEGLKEPSDQVELVHRTYAPLWRDEVPIPEGTIRTGSMTDPSANPWPTTVQSLLRVVDVDLFDFIGREAGPNQANGIRTYVRELVESRNKIAHGDDSVRVTADDVRRMMQWATRFARAADDALGVKLVELTGRGWS